MKKTKKKSVPKASHKKVKDLQIKPVKGATVRGGGWDVKANTKY